MSLVGLSDSGFEVEPSSLSMGRSTPSTSLSLMVPRELASAELTAEAVSLPMNAEVSSTSVEDSGIAARVCSFVFAVGAAGDRAGTTDSATLSLEGAYGLLSEESVTVSLSVAGAGVEGVLVSPVEVTFDSVSTSARGGGGRAVVGGGGEHEAAGVGFVETRVGYGFGYDVAGGIFTRFPSGVPGLVGR